MENLFMSTESAGGEPVLETDSRFPSGPWVGFFLQKEVPGKHWMSLELTFAEGKVRGFGQDWVGRFVMSGTYHVEDGRCLLDKLYLGRHRVIYSGYNEGKGIWGVWEIPSLTRGGFRIWPQSMPDPTRRTLSESLDEPTGLPEEWSRESAEPIVSTRPS
jgi:hypothetical protein